MQQSANAGTLEKGPPESRPAILRTKICAFYSRIDEPSGIPDVLILPCLTLRKRHKHLDSIFSNCDEKPQIQGHFESEDFRQELTSGQWTICRYIRYKTPRHLSRPQRPKLPIRVSKIGGIAKWLRQRIANPSRVGSTPTLPLQKTLVILKR